MRLSMILLASVSLTACTQKADQVQVVNKGGEFFGQGSYASAGAGYVPPKLARYNPTPYEPDFSIQNGTTQMASMNETVYQQAPTQMVSSNNLAEIKPEKTTAAASPKAESAGGNWLKSLISMDASEPKTTTAASQHEFIPPVQGSVASAYGKRGNGVANDGVNYILPAGEPVYASADGNIVYVGDELKSYGQMVIIKHANGYNTSYAHMSQSKVFKGNSVRQGDIIGYVGQTGNVDKPQLHFAVRKGTTAVDPSTVLTQSIASR